MSFEIATVMTVATVMVAMEITQCTKKNILIFLILAFSANSNHEDTWRKSHEYNNTLFPINIHTWHSELCFIIDHQLYRMINDQQTFPQLANDTNVLNKLFSLEGFQHKRRNDGSVFIVLGKVCLGLEMMMQLLGKHKHSMNPWWVEMEFLSYSDFLAKLNTTPMVRLEATKPRDASVETWNPEEWMSICEKPSTANFV